MSWAINENSHVCWEKAEMDNKTDSVNCHVSFTTRPSRYSINMCCWIFYEKKRKTQKRFKSFSPHPTPTPSSPFTQFLDRTVHNSAKFQNGLLLLGTEQAVKIQKQWRKWKGNKKTTTTKNFFSRGICLALAFEPFLCLDLFFKTWEPLLKIYECFVFFFKKWFGSCRINRGYCPFWADVWTLTWFSVLYCAFIILIAMNCFPWQQGVGACNV